MDPTMDQRRGFPLWLYLAIAVALIVIGTVGLIGGWGLFPATTGIALLFGVPFRRRRGVVAGLTTGALVFSATYLLTAPLGCFVSMETGPGRHPRVVRGCSRALLPDLEREAQPADRWLALSLASAVAVAGGIGTGVVVSRASKPSR
jgi:hypothetical protein